MCEHSHEGMERIRIESMEDIITKVPAADIDNFLVDLKQYVLSAKQIISAINATNATIGMEVLRKEESEHLGFDWINDGKTGGKINIEIRQVDKF